jgi:prophage regulatory protein
MNSMTLKTRPEKKTGPAAPSAADDNRLIGGRDVRRLTSLSRATLYRLVRDGQFPKPVRVAHRRVAWRATDVAAWLETRETVTWAA